MTVSQAQFDRWLANPAAKRCTFCHLHYLYEGSPCPSINVLAAANGATASADSTAANGDPSYAIDGDRAGQFLPSSGTGHWAAGSVFPGSSTLTVTPSGTVTINRVVMVGLQDTGNGATGGTATGPVVVFDSEPNAGTIAHDWSNSDYTVQYSDDGGGSWHTFITVTGNTHVLREHTSGDAEWTGDWITGNKFRINVTAGNGRRARIAELEAWTPDPLVGTLYFAEQPKFVDGYAYRDCIARVPNFEMQIDPTTFTGPFTTSVGELVLDDVDGSLDPLLTAVVDGQTCEFFCGDPDWDIDDILAYPAFTATIEKIEQTGRIQKTVKLRLPDLLLDATFVGKLLQSGQRAPIALGQLDFAEAVPEDTANDKYRFADRAFWYVPRTATAIQEMFDNGVSLNGRTFSPSSAAPTITQTFDDYNWNNSVADTDGTTPGTYVVASFADIGLAPIGITLVVYLVLPAGFTVESVYTSSSTPWTLEGGAATALGDGSNLYVYWTVATGFASTTFRAYFSASTWCKVQTVAISNTDGAGPHKSGATTGSGATITAPSLTPTASQNMLRLDMFFSQALTPAGNSQASGETEIIEGYASDSGGMIVVMSIDYLTLATTSGVGTGTKTSTNSNPTGSNIGYSMLFKGNPVSINTGTGVWTIPGHQLTDNDVLTIGSTGTLPTTSPQIIDPASNYSRAQIYVDVLSADTFKLYSQKDAVGLISVSSATYSGDLTITSRRYWDNGDGSANLVDRPDGTVHAKFCNDYLGGSGTGHRASDMFAWGWNTAAGFAQAGYSGAHDSFPRGDANDANLGWRGTEPTKIKDFLTQVAFSSNSAWGFDRFGSFAFMRLRTNPLLIGGSPTSAFDTAARTFTDDDVAAGSDVRVSRAITKYSTINAWASMNRPPLTQVASSVDAATAKQYRDKGISIASADVADGGVAASPGRYHQMIESEQFETLLPEDPVFSTQWANFKRDNQAPWIEFREFTALADAMTLSLCDYVTAEQTGWAHDEALGDHVVQRINLKLSRADNYTVDLTLVRRRASTGTVIDL